MMAVISKEHQTWKKKIKKKKEPANIINMIHKHVSVVQLMQVRSSMYQL